MVEDQDYVGGRDPVIDSPAHVYRAVDPATAPTLPPARTYTWNLLRDWAATRQPQVARAAGSER